MRLEWSLRARLTIWYSFALAVGLALFAAAIWLSMRQSLIGDLDHALSEHTASLEAFVNTELQDPSVHLTEELNEYFHAFPQDTYLVLRKADGPILFSSSTQFPFSPASDGRTRFSSLSWNRHRYRVLSQFIKMQGKPAQVIIAGSMDSIHDLLSRLRSLLLALVPIVIVLAATGGAWLSRRALRPVDMLAAAAGSISINNLSERLIVPQTGDELQRLSEKWNAMLSRLEAAVTRLSRFTADASHELRTPLAIIRTSAEIAARKSRSAESYRAALNQIVIDSERMTHLVEDLLLLARCDAEAADLPMSAVDLRLICQDVCVQIRPWADTRELRLVASIDDSPITIKGSEPALRRLMLALMTNAIQFSPKGERVDLRLSVENVEAILEVSDHGSGIPEAVRDLIFERFYRAPEARAASPNGSGLGLSLASGIAQRHGARIEVISAVGRGSTFRVSFPLSGNVVESRVRITPIAEVPAAER